MNESTEPAPRPDGSETVIRCDASNAFSDWISRCGGSLALTTYQAGKVALIGWDPVARQVTLLLRQFEKPMGLATRLDPLTGRVSRLALATRHTVLGFSDAPAMAGDYLEPRTVRGRARPAIQYDALYLPRTAHFTGDLNVHDIAFDADGNLWICNTRFSCLARLDDRFSFVPQWKPPFVSDIVPEDRCHLNGLAQSSDGRPRFVTCLGETDTPGGWRDGKATGGVLVDVETSQIVLRGLSMPHSPRLHGSHAWLLNSGAGELWRVDLARGMHDVVCALPGYLRGLCFVGPHHAAIGMCQVREKHLFGGLPVLQRHGRLLCGVAIVDLRSGTHEATFEFTAGAQELYDVQFLPGVHRPTILSQEKDATRQAFTAPDFAYWLRPGNEMHPA